MVECLRVFDHAGFFCGFDSTFIGAFASFGGCGVHEFLALARDPEVRVRANCAHALARLDTIPAAAIPLLVECTLDADDGLRTNAAMALSLAPAGMVAEVMQRLVSDSSSRVRLIAASSLLSAESSNPSAGAVLREARKTQLCESARRCTTCWSPRCIGCGSSDGCTAQE